MACSVTRSVPLTKAYKFLRLLTTHSGKLSRTFTTNEDFSLVWVRATFNNVEDLAQFDLAWQSEQKAIEKDSQVNWNELKLLVKELSST